MKRLGLKIGRRSILRGAVCASLMYGSTSANADSVADFYRGKTVNFEIGDAPGGGYDIYAHFVARFLGAHIPGNPVVVARNMPGAGSRTAAGYVYKVATPDGLTIGASEEALPLEQAVGDETIPFDTAKINWIGSPDADNKVVVTWFTSGVKTIEDAKNREVQMGASADTTSSQYLNAMNALIGTHFKIVYGYPGGGDINLAMERGESLGAAVRAGRPGKPSRNCCAITRSMCWCKSASTKHPASKTCRF